MTGPVQLIPESWKHDVIRILDRGDTKCIDWTIQAQRDWQQFGLPFQAHERLANELRRPDALGRLVYGMKGAREIWEFLLPHPLGSPIPLYAKIGLRDDFLTIKIFSTHIDRKGHLEQAIKVFLKKRKK